LKLTNKHGLPESIVNALRRPEYTKGKAHLSVTQLINSPKVVALSKKFQDELEQDVSEMVWSLFGSAIHKVLEHGKDQNHIVEQRLHSEVDGYRVSGAIDLQIVSDAGRAIRDYKTCSVWSVMNSKIEWEQQLNCYAWLVEKVTGASVTDLGIVAIIRDWNRRDAARNEAYPPAPIKELPIPLWPMEQREQYIQSRVHAHAEAEFAIESEGDVPACTPEEMWEKPTTYALKKKGGVRALKVYLSQEEANQALDPKTQEIEVRPGSRTRCESFCPVNHRCQQWRDYQESVK
jgi:hypothetical protein